ncbi:hypothetical protein N7492_006746 [Penicillium capsulatum]|uniref:67 kDa myosin-cross-reactive antigen family protein n=1 Tax=Penicillium capsulatum TaxID=69766 RepID=A0A9W9HYH6_9EURO|nr:hypothetical protein N7492_006746 [Penicillium capsulatum]KAJ6116582.1 hypothetical protein N7512_006307 [Penicillium capsulatum]
MCPQQDVQGKAHRIPKNVNAWILGSSLASLASAVHLISDANVPASQIHILESDSTPGDGITSTGDPVNGYDHRPGCLPSFNDSRMEKLLALVPSENDYRRTVLKDMKDLYGNEACQDAPFTHTLVQGDHGAKRMNINELGLSLKDRMKLIVLLLKSEDSLSRKRIDQLFNGSFFNSKLWVVISTMLRNNRFTFQPWHSAAEFRRCLRKYLHEFRGLNAKRPLDCTQFNQFESIILPIIHFLQNKGVDFRLRTRVMDIVSHSDGRAKSIVAIRVLRNGSNDTITVCDDDIVIVSLGSVTSGSISGTNSCPPILKTMIAEDALDENWSLWLNLGTKDPRFGDPYNFCTRVTESRLETFTVTLKNTEFFERFINLTCDEPGRGSLVALKDSTWKISICLPRQPFFSHQPDNIQTFWGYGLCPECEGRFVKKPMLACSGKEIMTEILMQLGFPLESTLSNSITIPCVMPRRTASLLPRGSGDRPNVIPDEMANLAVIGQFAEISDEPTVSMDYGVLGAQLAVSRLMGLHQEREKTRVQLSFSFLDLLF